MAESPDLTPQNERTRRLAERFGMTREDVEHLLSATNAEYSSPTLPPTEIAEESPIERAAERISSPPTSQPTVPTSTSQNKPLSGGVIAGIFIVLLIGLGIALSFREGCFEQRGMKQASKPVDTVQRILDSAAEQASAPSAPTQVAPGELPPESTTIPQESPPGTTGPPSHSTSPSESKPASPHGAASASKPLFTTTSEFQAQERLAELRADGNTHAHILAKRKGGSLSYQVFGK